MFGVCSCACVFIYDYCTAVLPELSSSGAYIGINSTSAREQINGSCTVMECTVKGEGEGTVEWRDREEIQKDVNIGQERGKRGGNMRKPELLD